MQIFIHQLHLTKAEVTFLNDNGWTEACAKNKRIALYQSKNPSIADLEEYATVGLVEGTNNLDVAFRVGNVGIQDDDEGISFIRLTATRMHSVSVGDILEVDTQETPHVPNQFYAVSPLGFTVLDPVFTG